MKIIFIIVLLGAVGYMAFKLFHWTALAKVMIKYSTLNNNHITEQEFDEILSWVMKNWDSDIYNIDGYR